MCPDDRQPTPDPQPGADPAPARAPQRGKLHPRLAFLLSLPLDELKKLKEREQKEAGRRAEELRKLEGGLRSEKDAGKRARLQERIRQLSRFAPLTHAIHFPDPDASASDSFPREPFVSAFVLSDAGAEDLEAGPPKSRMAWVGSQCGDVLTAFVPLRRVNALADYQAFRYIQPSRPLSADLDSAIPFAKIPDLRGSSAPGKGSGAGVIVGVIDNYFDVYHKDFYDAAGTDTRVLYLWDQNLTADPAKGEAAPPAMPGFPTLGGSPYGVEYDRAAIWKEVSGGGAPYSVVRHEPSKDPTNSHLAHGTLVAGCAVGNGSLSGGTYTGAAPEASLIFVAVGELPVDKYPRQLPILGRTIDNKAVADAFAYIFARAALEPGAPACVVNLSYSDMQGAHDGTDLGEQFLDELLTPPGRAITLSAGNWHDKDAHVQAAVPAAGPLTLKLSFAPVFDPTTGAAIPPTSNDAIEIWYPGTDRLSVAVKIPAAAAVPSWTSPTLDPPTVPGDAASLEDVSGDLPGGIWIHVDSVYQDPRNGNNAISIQIVVPAGAQIPTGGWSIALTRISSPVSAEVSVDAWLDQNNSVTWTAGTRNVITTGIPSTATSAITVGNHDVSGPPPKIRDDSGRGTTRTGGLKPDIAAVGTTVKGPSPQHHGYPNPAAAGQPDYFSASGTSFSAPIVAGACALLFECLGKTATWAELKHVLEKTAGDPSTAGTPAGTLSPAAAEAAFGYGYLKLDTACSAAPPAVDVYVRDDAADLGAEPFVGASFWNSPDVEVLDATGAAIANPVHDPANPASPNNVIRVTAHNRGTKAAIDTEVYLYWADPSTSLAFPSDWNSSGIHTGGAGAWTAGNKIVVGNIPTGGSAQVDFGWAPPAPGTSLRGDDHFCLLVRLENAEDPSLIGTGGWTRLTERNNIALRNTHVQTL